MHSILLHFVPQIPNTKPKPCLQISIFLIMRFEFLIFTLKVISSVSADHNPHGKSVSRKYAKTWAKSMLVTDVGDEMC